MNHRTKREQMKKERKKKRETQDHDVMISKCTYARFFDSIYKFFSAVDYLIFSVSNTTRN